MGRAGLIAAVAIAVIVGVVFGVWPELDLALSRWLFAHINPDFAAGTTVTILRKAALWLVALIAAPAFIAVALKLLLPRRAMLIPGRAALLMIGTLAIGPGIVTNVILKDHSHRPRPQLLKEFGRGNFD